MDEIKTKAIEKIERRMDGVDKSDIRHHILENAKSFKTSWIALGRALYTVWKDKLYKNWGYSNFDIYTSKEIGIRKGTALKLLRSYYFLEKEEPNYLSENYTKGAEASSMPTYESVNELRLASNKKEIDRDDYEAIKKKVFEKGGDAREIKKDLTQLIREREELLPEEAWKKKKLTVLKRFLSALRSVQKEVKISKMLPAQIIREVDSLISKLEAEMPR